MSGSFRSLGFRRSFSFTVLLAFIASTFFVTVHAADTIPRDKLIVEYMFNGGIADTSGNANTVINSGATFGVDTLGPINYANFSLGQISGLIGWQSTWSSSFAVSFWTKTPLNGRLNTAAMLSYCKKIYPSYSNVTYDTIKKNCVSGSTRLGGSLNPDQQTIFTGRRTGGSAYDIGVTLSADYNCFLVESTKFDCSILKDEKWHHFLIRKDDYGSFSIYIDGIKTSLVQISVGGGAPAISSLTLSKTITLGRSPDYNGYYSDNTAYIGQIGALRVYRADITEADINTLANEFPLLRPLPTSPANNQIPVITLTEPNDQPAPFKKISASTNIGALQMAIQPSGLCNSSTTATFEDYSPMTFNSASDNGMVICYKATNGANISYKMSSAIRGIATESALVSSDNIFSTNSYLSWVGSPRKKPSDFMFNILGTAFGGRTGVNFVDMNGDGLVDTLYYDNVYRAVLVNNGDYTFKIVYKCLTGNGGYYGDCADTNYKF